MYIVCLYTHIYSAIAYRDMKNIFLSYIKAIKETKIARVYRDAEGGPSLARSSEKVITH